jgi:heptosyltransferase-3
MLKKLEKSLKRAVAFLGRWMFSEEFPRREIPRAGELRRVLVIRQDNRLGNLLLITPLLHALRLSLPRARIFLIVSDAYPELFEGSADIDGLILFRKKELLRYPWRALRFLRRLRREGFDMAVDLSHPHSFSLSSALLARLCGAPHRLGFERGDARHYLTLRAARPLGKVHEADAFLLLLDRIGLKGAPGTLRYSVRKDERSWAVDEIGKLGFRAETDGPLVGIFTGGRGKKRIGIPEYMEIARGIEESVPGRIVFFLGPRERPRRKDFEQASEGRWIVAPANSLRQFAALLSVLDVLVTPDSGPMHLASAIGVPVVALFREDTAWHYGPRGSQDRILLFTSAVDSAEVALAVKRTLEQGPVKKRTPGGRQPA